MDAHAGKILLEAGFERAANVSFQRNAAMLRLRTGVNTGMNLDVAEAVTEARRR
ncbi:MAG TPA: hypothetical protein VMI53_01040 [Opitutaceae bacterium]|nr:hypothetical protein [Opitutaceae bacterium]